MLNISTIIITAILIHLLGVIAVSKYTLRIGVTLLILGLIIGIVFSLLGVR